jgi:hypothetical protein
MKLKLQARDLWDVIEFGDGDFRDDRTALDAICSAVPSEMIPTLAVKETVLEAWEAIKTLLLGDKRRRAVTAQTLRVEYEMIKLHGGEAIRTSRSASPASSSVWWILGIRSRMPKPPRSTCLLSGRGTSRLSFLCRLSLTFRSFPSRRSQAR